MENLNKTGGIKMAENQDELKIGIGNEKAVTLKPTKVKILNVRIEELGEKKSKKLICEVKHPDAEEPINISSVKYENKGKLEVSGLWVNKDSQNLIRMGSALAMFLNFSESKTPEELKNKEIQTIQDDNGYLVFKGY